MSACRDIPYVLDKLNWMRAERIWPNGLRYTWTDAFGVVLLVSLYAELNEQRFLDEAEWVVSEVERVLGRPRGIRIGEAADRDGQYFHYLAMWLYALSVLARHVPAYRAKGVDLVRQIHDAFVVPGRGVIWKMNEDLSAPYPGYGFGALDAFDGYVSYRRLDEHALAGEISDMRALIDASTARLNITQDLGLGMLLWLSHFFRQRTGPRRNDGAAPCAIGCGTTMVIFAASPISPKVCLHQLRRFGWTASCSSDDRTGVAAE
jgi:hypothetical protein